MRCQCCNKPRGLGACSAVIWEGKEWSWRTVRFCGQRCKQLFLLARKAALERHHAVSARYRQPP